MPIVIISWLSIVPPFFGFSLTQYVSVEFSFQWTDDRSMVPTYPRRQLPYGAAGDGRAVRNLIPEHCEY
jgi:hypothetical protein